MRSRIMVIGRDVAQRAHLARLLRGSGYRVEIAESAAHACRIGFDGIELAIVAPDGLGPGGKRPGAGSAGRDRARPARRGAWTAAASGAPIY